MDQLNLVKIQRQVRKAIEAADRAGRLYNAIWENL